MAADPKDDRMTIPLAEEVPVVTKTKRITGTVRLHKNVVEHEQAIDEPVTVEEIDIERVPMERWVDGPVPVRQEGNTTVISLLEEVVVVEKRLKLIEEIRLTTRRTTHHAHDQITVRREEAAIERLEPEPGQDPAPGTASERG